MGNGWLWCPNCGWYKESGIQCTCYPALREEAARAKEEREAWEREAKKLEGVGLLISIAIVAYFICAILYL